MATRDEVVALIVRTAHEHGLVPYELLGGAIAESNLDPTAWRQGVWPDWSAGLFQQTVAYADEGDQTASAENVALIKRLYFDPEHAADVAAAKYRAWRYDPEVPAEQAWCAYNWPGSYRHYTDNPNLANYRRGLSEAAAILGVDVPSTEPAPVYDPSVPVVPQNADWDCAEQSTLWAMTAYGRHPTEQWFESTMLADGIVSTEDGLLDASGAGLAAWLTKEYGEFNYAAHNNGHVSFDDVKSVAGHTPVLVGGRAWGHWSGVRSYDSATDTLQLANPANGWMQVGQSMTRQQFDALGPFSMVVITWTDPAPPPVVEPPAPPARTFNVGSGLLQAMTNVGEWPASDEVHHGDHGRGYAEAYSNQGRRWTWVDSLGIVVSSEGWQGTMIGGA